MHSQEAAELLGVVDRFAGRRIVVVGDLIADEYVYAKPTRISREAPVLILRYLSREMRLGGAANACHNLHALGASVRPIGVLGADRPGESVRRLLGDLRIPGDGVVTVAGRATPVKTRVMAGGPHASSRQQVVRVDREPEGPLPVAIEEALLAHLAAVGAEADAVVLSDYGYGTLTDRLLGAARAMARRGVVVTADSRHDLLRFEGMTAATPNEPEVEGLLGVSLDDDKAVEEAGWRLLDRLGSALLVVTRGSRGLALFERGGAATFVPIFGSDEVTDVTGAGDTVISVFTLALAAGAAPGAAARLANCAGGLVVMKRGTATVTPDELHRAVRRGAPDGAGPGDRP